MFNNDKPCGEDLFGSKSHERIADSLCKTIKNNSQVNMIGLEGDWGSGKSNIIEILKNKLAEEAYIFVYDAWGHQEDLHRRAFLEELTRKLIQNNLVSDEWESKVDNLLARTRKNVTRTIPQFNLYLIFLALAFGLNMWTSKFDLSTLKILLPETLETYIKTFIDQFDVYRDLIAWLALEMIRNIPILISALIITIRIILKGQEVGIKKAFKVEMGKIAHFYNKEESSKEVYESISSKEPSVHEFKEWMGKLDKALKKPVIIVYDNMDRLQVDKVSGVWSSVHTFFSEVEYERIYTIIPFDRTQIQKALGDYQNSNICKNEWIIDGDNYINKTMKVIYRVPPPVLSDWKGFFKLKAKELFQELDENKIITMRNIYDTNSISITPREIILFLNDIYVLYDQWEGCIEVEYIALFVLKKKLLLKNPVKQILSGEYLASSKHLFGDDTDRYMAALIYNVNPKDADQVLLGREIELTMRTADDERLLYMMNKYSSFNYVLEQYFNSLERVGNEVDTLWKAMTNYDFKKSELQHLELVVFRKFMRQEIKNIDCPEGLLGIISLNPNKVNLILEHVFDSFSKVEHVKGKQYSECLNLIEDILIDAKLNEKFNIRDFCVEIELSNDEYFNFINEKQCDPDDYKIAIDSKKIASEIENLLEQQKYNDRKIVLLQNLKKDNKIFQHLQNKLRDISKNKVIKEVYALRFIFDNEITSHKPNLDTLARMITNNDKLTLSLIILSLCQGDKISYISGSYINRVMNYLNNKNADFVKDTKRYVDMFVNLQELINLTVTSSYQLINSLIVLGMKNDEYQDILIKDTLKQYDVIKSRLDYGEENILNFLSNKSEMEIKEINEHNIIDIFDNVDFIKSCLKYKNNLTTHIVSVYVSYFKQVDKKSFTNIITNNHRGLADIYSKLIQEHIIVNVSRNIAVAIQEHLISLLDNLQKVDRKYLDCISTTINIISKEEMVTCFKNIRDKFINKVNIENFMPDFFFSLLSKEEEILSERADESVRRIINPLIKSGLCEDIFIGNGNSIANVINNANESRYEFLNYLEERLLLNPKYRTLKEIIIDDRVQDEVASTIENDRGSIQE